MRNQYHKIARLQRFKTKNHADMVSVSDQKTCNISFLEKISLTRKYIFEILLISSILLVIVLLYLELKRPEIIIDTIDVPEDIEKLGYTGNIVAEKLADEAHKIVMENQTISPQKSWQKEAINTTEVMPNAQVPDILLPIAQSSVRSITRFIRQEFGDNFGLKSIYVRGEIVHVNSNIVLTLRKLSGVNSPLAIEIVTNRKRIESLFKKGGASLLRLTDPSSLAIYAYQKFERQLRNSTKTDKIFTQVVQASQYCLKYPPKTDDSLAHNLWGNALLSLKRTNEAIEQYKKALDIDPDFASAFNNWGNALLDLKRPKEAIGQYKKAIDIDPMFASPYNNWGNALLILGDISQSHGHYYEGICHFKMAIALYKKTISLDPKFAIAYINLGNAFTRIEQYDDAIVQYKNAIATDPQYAAAAYNNWGQTLVNSGQLEDAIEQYINAIKIDSQNAQAYKNWGDTLLILGQTLNDHNRFEEAIDKFKKSTDIDPKDPDTFSRWGNALVQLKRPKQAIEQCKIAIKIDPNFAFAYEIWGSALFELKQPDLAKKQFKKAKDIKEKTLIADY